MKKFLALVSAFSVITLLLASQRVLAQSSTPTVSTTPSTTPTGKTHKKKKGTPTPTPQATVQATASPTASPTVTPKATTPPTSTPTASSAPKVFSENPRLYDRVGAPGDLRKAAAVAARTMSYSIGRHDHSIFLWLGRVTSGSDSDRENAYIRFELNGVAYAGPKKPSLVLTGTVYEQSGSDTKVGDFIQVAVDFRDIKVDYEGTKLGEVNKGNDIADQVYDLLISHSSYQLVVLAQDWLKDPQDNMGMPTYVAKAGEGFVFLQALNSHSNASDH